MLKKPTLLIIATAAALVASTASAGLADTAGPLVPARGTVAGHGYAYYLERAWRTTFAGPALPKTCNTIPVGGQRVAMLLGGYSGKPEKHICSVSAGEPIYVDGISEECSTIHGDHGKFGTTDTDLKRCARAIYLGGHATGGASVDGRPVAELAKTIVATGVYLIHLPEKNILGAKQRSGRSAAYGEGLLLSGFSRGTHSIVTTGKLGKFHAEVTDTVTIG